MTIELEIFKSKEQYDRILELYCNLDKLHPQLSKSAYDAIYLELDKISDEEVLNISIKFNIDKPFDFEPMVKENVEYWMEEYGSYLSPFNTNILYDFWKNYPNGIIFFAGVY